MIVIRYTGGLGNQMFIYAMNVVLKNKFPNEKIYADLSRYDITNEHDGFDIKKYFEICIDVVPNSIIKSITPINYWMSRLKMNKILSNFDVAFIEKVNERIERKNMQIGIIPDLDSTNYNENAFEINKEKINFWHYKGNWINPLYWKGYEQEVKNAFTFKKGLLSEQDCDLIDRIESEKSVSIHIRKGDYVGNERFDLCTDKYYENAINYLEKCIDDNDMKYYIFAEEYIELSYLKNKDQMIIFHPDNCGIDLWIMSKCKYNIIANSTFSYWAAMLNKNKDKIVIAPKYAYREKAVYRKLPVPENWVQIDNVHYN